MADQKLKTSMRAASSAGRRLFEVDWLLIAILSTTAGAVDVIGFLGLGGLFTAHITGNLVVLAAHYVTGKFGQIGPLLSVPVFIIVLGMVTERFGGKPIRKSRRILLLFQAGLLATYLAFAAKFGPFPDPDGGMPVFAGMLGVAAMATQNALVRLALPGFPSTAVMTTNITQLSVDLASLVRGKGEPEKMTRAQTRAAMTSMSVAGFVVGCAAGGYLELHFGLRALLLPVLLAALAIPLGELLSVESPATL